jgi:UDP-N-acetyl-2-amino-2-deoxyglucuronate dehydrogenase
MTFHVGILGGGNISETHARAAQAIDGVEIVAFCGENAERVRHLAATFGGRAYEDPQLFFDHNPMDAVIIGSPSGLHAEQGIESARRGLNVLTEKPVAVTTAQADRLIAACEKAGVKLAVFFQDRVASDVLKLKKLIDGGALGKPFLVSARVKWYRPPEYYKGSRWRGTWALDGGGALMNQGVHTIDLLLWLMGDVSRVWARAVTAINEIEVEDTLVAAVEFRSGAVGTLEAATSVYPGYPRRLEVTGSEGTIILENDRLTSIDLRAPSEFTVGQATLRDERSVSPVISDPRGHRLIIEDFQKAIATGEPPLCDGNQGRRSVELVEALYESAHTGQAVNLTNGD